MVATEWVEGVEGVEWLKVCRLFHQHSEVRIIIIIIIKRHSEVRIIRIKGIHRIAYGI